MLFYVVRCYDMVGTVVYEHLFWSRNIAVRVACALASRYSQYEYEVMVYSFDSAGVLVDGTLFDCYGACVDTI